MNDADSTPDHGLTTEQIATAGTRTGQGDVPMSAEDESYDNRDAASFGAGDAASGRTSADVRAGSHASLLEDGELQSITARWKDIQAEFVDEPSKAVQEADELVAELMQRLATMFASERTDLEKRWSGDDGQVSTEDLRQGLRRYRSFFERLLAA
jgi:hypothetical protein